MAISKVVYNEQTLIDLTGDTVTSASLLSGYTAHGADGEPILGMAQTGTNDYEELNNIPLINGNLLIGNKTTSDLGIPTGTVTQVSTGTGLTGGPINSSGTISLATAGTGAGTSGPTSNVSESYGTTTLTVPYVTTDEYGRVSGRGTTSNTLRNSVPVYNSTTGTHTYTESEIYVSTTDLTAGSSSLATGRIYLVYE